jgi:hypothetical protein
MSNPKIEPTRAFNPTDVPEASIPKGGTTRTIRPAGGNIQDAVVSQERSGLVNTKADPAKPVANAKTPPLSGKSIPTSSVAERLRERLKKGG